MLSVFFTYSKANDFVWVANDSNTVRGNGDTSFP